MTKKDKIQIEEFTNEISILLNTRLFVKNKVKVDDEIDKINEKIKKIENKTVDEGE